MLKYLFWIIGIFALAVGAVYLFSNINGSLFLLIDSKVYSVTLKWFLYVLIAVLVIIFLLYLVISWLWGIPRRLGKAHARRKKNHLADSLNKTALAFFEGRYNHAIKQVDELLKNKYAKDLKVTALVLGAESANQVAEVEKRDDYLIKIDKEQLSGTIYTSLLRAEVALNNQDYQKFQEYCKDIKWHNPKLTALSELYLAYALEVENADIILQSIEQLQKNHAISQDDYLEYELLAYQIKLEQTQSSLEVKKFWKSLSGGELTKDGCLILDFGWRYYALRDYESAVDWSLEQYKNTKCAELLEIISKSFTFLSEKNKHKTLRTLEDWLEEDRENADLLLLLGNLAYQNQLWGKAQGYLEASITVHPTVTGWAALSKLYAQQGEYERANQAGVNALDMLNISVMADNKIE